MRYIYSTVYFCTTIETGAYMVNSAIDWRHHSPPHPLETLAITWAESNTGAPKNRDNTGWCALPPAKQSNALTCVSIYLDEFVSVLQGVPKEHQQIT